MKEVNLKITEDGITIQLVNENGITEHRNCEKDELLKLIQGSLDKKERIQLSSGVLHKNIIEIDSAFHTGTGDLVKEYYLYVDKGPLAFNYLNKVYPFDEFPALLFRFKVDQNNKLCGSSSVFVVKDKRDDISDNTVLYEYPFGNVSSGGSICWGGNQLPAINEPKDLFKAVDMFFQAPTGDHNYNSNTVKFDGPQSKLLKDLISNEITIDDVLVRYDIYSNFKERNNKGVW